MNSRETLFRLDICRRDIMRTGRASRTASHIVSIISIAKKKVENWMQKSVFQKSPKGRQVKMPAITAAKKNATKKIPRKSVHRLKKGTANIRRYIHRIEILQAVVDKAYTGTEMYNDCDQSVKSRSRKPGESQTFRKILSLAILKSGEKRSMPPPLPKLPGSLLTN